MCNVRNPMINFRLPTFLVWFPNSYFWFTTSNSEFRIQTSILPTSVYWGRFYDKPLVVSSRAEYMSESYGSFAESKEVYEKLFFDVINCSFKYRIKTIANCECFVMSIFLPFLLKRAWDCHTLVMSQKKCLFQILIMQGFIRTCGGHRCLQLQLKQLQP